MGWMVHTEGTVRHVWPSDETGHNTGDDLKCVCNPTSSIAEGGIVVVIHNSKDGREFIERLVESDNISPN